MAWHPAGKRVLCDLHGEEFPRGHVCPQCGPSDVAAESETAQAPARPPGAESVAEHELAFCADARASAKTAADLRRRIAPEVEGLRECAAMAARAARRRKIDPGILAKLLNVRVAALGRIADLEARVAAIRGDGRDQAIKARRAAAELARWREDWTNVEALERVTHTLRRAGTAAAAAEVRH